MFFSTIEEVNLESIKITETFSLLTVHAQNISILVNMVPVNILLMPKRKVTRPQPLDWGKSLN